MLTPNSRLIRFWDWWLMILTVFSAVEIPARVVIDYPVEGAFLVIDVCISGFFLLDVIRHFFTAMPQGNRLITSRRKVASRYLRGWFFIDLLSAIPFDLLLGVGDLNRLARATRILRLFRMLRLLRLARLAQFMRRLGSTTSINPVILRMVFLIFWVLMFAHWCACGFMALGGIGDDKAAEASMKYLLALYWSFTTLTTVGYGDISPAFNDPPMIIYGIVIQCLGAGLYGYVIGNVASLLANIDVAKAHHSEKMEKLQAFLKYRRIPTEMQTRIRDYYDYLWESRLGYDESQVISDLPLSLKAEVSMFMNRGIIEKVPVFKGAEESLIRDIALSLKPVVYTPGVWIVHRGEVGEEMYFISRGVVEVVSEDGKEVYATLGEGSFFGEIALLLVTPRTASIRAADYCDLYTMDRPTFGKILRKYPSFAREVRRLAEKRARDLGLSLPSESEDPGLTPAQA